MYIHCDTIYITIALYKLQQLLKANAASFRLDNTLSFCPMQFSLESKARMLCRMLFRLDANFNFLKQSKFVSLFGFKTRFCFSYGLKDYKNLKILILMF